MSVDIYTKNPEDDSDFRSDIVDIYDDKEIYLNQIRNLFSASSGMVMGASDMSVDLDYLIFNTAINEKALERRILEKIYRYCTLNYKFKTNVKVKFLKGATRDGALIDIIVNDTKRLELRVF